MSDWIVGYGGGLTGPSTPRAFGPTCGEAVYWESNPDAGAIPSELHHTVVSCGKETIAIIPPGPNKDEHARLFAASREILEACVEVEHHLKHFTLHDAECLTVDVVAELLDTLRAAIAKATGQN